MFYPYLIVIGVLLLSTPFVATAQQAWGIYFGNTSLPDSRFSVHHELQLRDYQMIGDHQQSLLRLGLQYRLSDAVNLTAGYGYIYTEAEGSPNLPFSENRIYQEASFRQRYNIVRIRHRLRTEERFLRGSFRGRLRYCLFLDIPLNDRQMNKGAIYAALYDEVFLNAFPEDNAVFDRNRLYGGLGYKVSEGLGIQLGYMRQHVGLLRGTNHLLLSFHHQIKL